MRIGLVAVTLLLSAIVVGACGEDTQNDDSQTHWLDECAQDSECGSGLGCECGRCVAVCDANAACTVSGRTTECFDSTNSAVQTLCGARPAPSLCLEPCAGGDDCPAGQSCRSGACVPELAAGGAGGGATGTGGNGAGGASGGVAGADPCAGIAQCQLPCPEPQINPTDENGCVHTCECVPPGGSSGLKLFFSCGDPVCSGHTPVSTLPACTTEMAGDDCTEEGLLCDPGDECNRRLTCALSDPADAPGGCPISRQRFKRDIRYLDGAELARYRDELLSMKLATWRYKHDPSRQHLGFIIDDNERSVAVDEGGEVVDLYGYASLAVATLQLQARQIEELQRELADLKRQSTPR